MQGEYDDTSQNSISDQFPETLQRSTPTASSHFPPFDSSTGLTLSNDVFSSQPAFQVPHFLELTRDPAFFQYPSQFSVTPGGGLGIGAAAGGSYEVRTPSYNDPNQTSERTSFESQSGVFSGAFQSYQPQSFAGPSGLSSGHGSFANPHQIQEHQTAPAPNEPSAGLPFTTDSGVTQQLDNIPRPTPSSMGPLINGFPIYSASGFDLMDILAKVHSRPNPKVNLGAVDLTCAFAVVDITLPDEPIVHVSPGFKTLTGYEDHEVIGRNCRFLQAPPGVQVTKTCKRSHTDNETVSFLARSLAQDKEVQVNLVNYKKNGQQFLNCLTIIPLHQTTNSVRARYHVGFQVDLAEQPRMIMQAIQNGRYNTNYTAMSSGSRNPNRSIPLAVIQAIAEIGQGTVGDRHELSATLISNSTDPIVVVSVKGHFLYASPSLARFLGHEESWFCNKNLSDICHPADIAAVMRTLKDCVPSQARNSTDAQNPPPVTRTGPVFLLFRVLHKNGDYMWVDCSGRLHSEVGQRGRKSLFFTMRQRDMPRLTWSSLNSSGGISADDCWVRIARDSRALILAASPSVQIALGRTPDEVIGTVLTDYVLDDESGRKKAEIKNAINLAHQAKEVDEVAKFSFCNIPTPTPLNDSKGKNKDDMLFDSNEVANNLSIATMEIAIFPPKRGADPPNTTPTQDDGGVIWRNSPHTMLVRLRVVKRQEVSEVQPGSRTYACNSSLNVPTVASSKGKGPLKLDIPNDANRRLASTRPRRSIYVNKVGNVSDLLHTRSEKNNPTNLADSSIATWGYELRQLQTANERLKQEIRTIEKERKVQRKQTKKSKQPKKELKESMNFTEAPQTSASTNNAPQSAFPFNSAIDQDAFEAVKASFFNYSMATDMSTSQSTQWGSNTISQQPYVPASLELFASLQTPGPSQLQQGDEPQSSSSAQNQGWNGSSTMFW